MPRILDDFVGGLVQKFFSLRNEENSGPQDFAPVEQSAESVTPTLKGRLVEAAREQLRASEAARTSGTRSSSADGASLWGGSREPAQPPMVFGALFEQPRKQSEGEGLFGGPSVGSSIPTQGSWLASPSDAPGVSIFGEMSPDEIPR